jgi:hypothetical protein
MKIIVDYDPVTGFVRNPSDSLIICTILALRFTPFEEEKRAKKEITSVELVRLKQAGFTSEEIVEMHQKGVL